MFGNLFSAVLFLFLMPISHLSAASLPSEQLGVRWLKNTASPRVQQWLAEENKKTRDFLTLNSNGQADPFFDALTKRAKELLATNSAITIPTAHGALATKGGALVLKTTGGAEVVLAPRITHEDGSGVSSVAEFRMSPDGGKVAICYIKNGSDLSEWNIMDLTSRQMIAGPFLVRLNDFSWAVDSNHIFYTKSATYPEMARKMFYARNFRVSLRTKEEEFIFEPPQTNYRETYGIKDFEFSGVRHLVAHRKQGAAEVPLGVYVRREGIPAQWQAVRLPLRHRLGKFIAVKGSKLYLRSTEAGNNFGIVSVDIGQNMKTESVVAARTHQVLIVAEPAGNHLLLQYFDAESFAWSVEVADFSGRILKRFQLSDVGLSNFGTVSSFTVTGPTARFTYSDVGTPVKTLALNLQSLGLEVLPDAAPIPFDGSKIQHERHMIPSLDGTLVPIDVYTRRDIRKPAFGYLFYYGYIGIPQFGWWSRKFQLALEMNGAVVIVHQRGGGERGRDWQMGVKVDRMPSLQDTVAAARWMRGNLGVEKIVASGRSFGGLHTMGALIHYPNEFEAFVPVVPVADINEFLSEGMFGFFAVDDFGIDRDAGGNPQDTPTWRARLAQWSPLANLTKLNQLKPVMIFSADHDERIGPEQAYYMTEALNVKFPGNKLVHLYSEKNNGHNARTETVDEMAFVGRTFGIQQLNPIR